MAYELHVNRWDDPSPIEEIPATGVEFSYPLSDHGEASFTARVTPGRSAWRSALAAPLSGVLIASDGIPIWDGWVTSDDEGSDRTFSFRAREWGYIFESFRQPGRTPWTDDNDHQIFRDLVTEAQAVQGQNVGVVVDPTTFGAHNSTKTINAWDDARVGTEFREVADAEGGPEWYFSVTGTLDNPQRRLYLADKHGDQSTEGAPVLEYVEDTEPEERPGDALVVLLGDVFGGGPRVVRVRKSGGNVIAKGRGQNVENAATQAIAIDGGTEAAQRRVIIPADLVNAGWPRLTRSRSYSEYQTTASLIAHARADLKAARGIATGYSLVTLEGDPDWTQVGRGSMLRVVLDTDVYGGERPVGGQDGFTTRLRNKVVRVPASGTPQIEWQVANVVEV